MGMGMGIQAASSTVTTQSAAATQWQQQQQNFKNLTTALQSGNLAAAQQAFSTMTGGTGTVNGITLTGTVTSTGNLTLGGTLSGVNLATQVTGTLPIANGGTGISAAGTSGNVLTSDGTNWASTPPAASGITAGKSISFALVFGF